MKEMGKTKNISPKGQNKKNSYPYKKFDMFNYSPSYGPLEEYLSKRDYFEQLFLKCLEKDDVENLVLSLERVKTTKAFLEFLIRNSYQFSSIEVLRFFWENKHKFSLTEDDILGGLHPHIFGCINNLSFICSFYELVGDKLFSLVDKSGNKFVVYALSSEDLDIFDFIYEKKRSAFEERNIFNEENIMHNIALLSFEFNFFLKIKEKFDFLIEKGFSHLLSSPDIYGNLPLHFAIAVRNMGFVENAFKVLGKDSSWFYENKDGKTPIDLIYKGEDFEVPIEVRKRRGKLFLYLYDKGLVQENENKKEIRKILKSIKLSKN